MNRLILSVICSIALLLIVTSCDPNRVFEDYKAIPEEGWHKDSIATFEVHITDTTQNHHLYLNVRNDINYKYSNLWLFTKLESPDQMISQDTFQMVLADQSGRWLGEGFAGKKNNQALFRANVNFPRSGLYRFSVQQGMRDEILSKISDIGVRIEKAE